MLGLGEDPDEGRPSTVSTMGANPVGSDDSGALRIATLSIATEATARDVDPFRLAPVSRAGPGDADILWKQGTACVGARGRVRPLA